ncbi:MAG: enolase C-terminal domain-like protein [Verrucomicrobiota bacterium]
MSTIAQVRTKSVRLYYLPVETRMPLKFGIETLTNVMVARTCVQVETNDGSLHEGWGETPLSVQWVWPGSLPYVERLECMQRFCEQLAKAMVHFELKADALEWGWQFQETRLHDLWNAFNTEHRQGKDPMPWLASLVCMSLFDIAIHDAWGKANQRPVYECYAPECLAHDLSRYLTPAHGMQIDFCGKFPSDYLIPNPPHQLKAWHLVGGVDPISEDDLTGHEPEDGYPVLLRDWIRKDGLKCLKIKLRGNDADWDFNRLCQVGTISIEEDVEWLTADFNCTVTDPAYVDDILDRLRDTSPRIYGMLLYVEQPFPYELEEHPIDVHSVSSRKPLFLDESAHDWKLVRLGRELGWTGVALKTCKTQSGAILSACWAKAHGMTLMVQDLTNPMLAQIPHVQLASHTGTIMGVETNAMQFYPEASAPERIVHPGIYRRQHGMLDTSTIQGHGFGYRMQEIQRTLPEPALVVE